MTNLTDSILTGYWYYVWLLFYGTVLTLLVFLPSLILGGLVVWGIQKQKRVKKRYILFLLALQVVWGLVAVYLFLTLGINVMADLLNS